jgi:hypothetical protein
MASVELKFMLGMGGPDLAGKRFHRRWGGAARVLLVHPAEDRQANFASIDEFRIQSPRVEPRTDIASGARRTGSTRTASDGKPALLKSAVLRRRKSV